MSGNSAYSYISDICYDINYLISGAFRYSTNVNVKDHYFSVYIHTNKNKEIFTLYASSEMQEIVISHKNKLYTYADRRKFRLMFKSFYKNNTNNGIVPLIAVPDLLQKYASFVEDVDSDNQIIDEVAEKEKERQAKVELVSKELKNLRDSATELKKDQESTVSCSPLMLELRLLRRRVKELENNIRIIERDYQVKRDSLGSKISAKEAELRLLNHTNKKAMLHGSLRATKLSNKQIISSLEKAKNAGIL